MKSSMTALDIFYLVKELQELVGGKVDKIYQVSKRELEFRFYVPNKGKKVLLIKLPDFMYLSEYKQLHPENPFNFCIFLRKRLENSWVKEIKQNGFERVVEFVLEKDKNYKLIFELFSKGNLILCDEEYKIISPLQIEKWKDRSITPNTVYKFPKKDLSIFKVKPKDVKESKKAIVKFLAADLGLGSIYAEEVCFLSKIDKMTETLDEKQIKLVLKNTKGLFKKDIKAKAYEKVVAPFEIKSLKDPKPEKFNSFNQALDEIITEKTVKEAKVVDKHQEKINKVQEIIRIQTERAEGLKKSIVENTQKAEFIYNNYTEVDKVLNQLKDEFKKSPKTIQEKFGSKVKSVDPKTKEVIIEFKK